MAVIPNRVRNLHGFRASAQQIPHASGWQKTKKRRSDVQRFFV